jgi:hypothetical protein
VYEDGNNAQPAPNQPSYTPTYSSSAAVKQYDSNTYFAPTPVKQLHDRVGFGLCLEVDTAVSPPPPPRPGPHPPTPDARFRIRSES